MRCPWATTRFSTKDTKAPEQVYTYPSGTLMKSSLDPIAPYVIFSEGVTAHSKKYVTFKNGAQQYKLAANDVTCTTAGTTAGACVEIDGLGNKVTFYPKGKSLASPIGYCYAVYCL